VRRHTARAFSASEQDVLSRLARMTGAALAGAAPVATAEAGPRTDTVTGWPGPRRFSADTGAAVRTADRHALPVSVVAAHLEGLARVRADLGQEPADGILRTLALALSEVLRVGDVAYRIGEDEFALLLPATGDDALPAVRSRLRDVVTDVLTAVDLPGTPRQVGLRTAQVPLDAVRQGTDAVDAALGAVGVPAQRVRWSLA
jgi:diguanylate cyclase (GGDEF)-like protein